MNVRKIALYGAVAALMLPAIANAGTMKPGKWQISIETKIAGMDMKMPAMTLEHCYTPEEVDNPQPPKGKNDACNVQDYKVDGNTVTWKVDCPKQGMSGDGKMTLGAETYEGEVHMKAQGMDVTQKLNGKRLGDCEPKK